MVAGKASDIDRASEKEQSIKFKWGITLEGMSCDNTYYLVDRGGGFLFISDE